MPENLIFHESFDSTRTADRYIRPNLAQAQAEGFISLLLGHTLTLPNTYAFDARGVLDFFPMVLSTRDEVRSGLKSGSAARERLDRASPFLLCTHNAPSFFQACATQLRNFQNPDRRFFLSAWGAIDLEFGRRAELASVLLSSSRPRPPAWLGEYADFPEHFDALLRINDFAGEFDRGRPTNPEPGTDLIVYLNRFHELGQEGEPLRDLARLVKCPEDIAVKLHERLNLEMRRAAEEGDADRLKSRSWVYVAVREAREQGRGDAKLLEQLRELIDTFYNARLAQSAYAENGFMSSVPRSSDDDGLRQVNDLAIQVINGLLSRKASPPLAGVFTAATSTATHLASEPLQVLLRSFWELMADDSTHLSWQQSGQRISSLLEARPEESDTPARGEWTGEFEDAWADHLSLLSGHIPGVERDEDGTLRTRIQCGGIECQAAQGMVRGGAIPAPEVPAPEAVQAVGRYVTDLAQGVNE